MAIRLFGAGHVCTKQDVSLREILAAHKSAFTYTVKGGNGWCLRSQINMGWKYLEWSFSFYPQCRPHKAKTQKWICWQFAFSPPSIWWRRGDEWAYEKFHVLVSILTGIWSALTLMDFNGGADTLWNQSGWCESCWKEWWLCKNLVYFHQERSIWQHVTKDEVVCMRCKGRGAEKTEYISNR